MDLPSFFVVVRNSIFLPLSEIPPATLEPIIFFPPSDNLPLHFITNSEYNHAWNSAHLQVMAQLQKLIL